MTNLETRGPRRGACGGPRGIDVPTDAELLTRWSVGNDPGALEQLVRRHGGMVSGVCRRVLDNTPDVDDAFQATFLISAQSAVLPARNRWPAGSTGGAAWPEA